MEKRLYIIVPPDFVYGFSTRLFHLAFFTAIDEEYVYTLRHTIFCKDRKQPNFDIPGLRPDIRKFAGMREWRYDHAEFMEKVDGGMVFGNDDALRLKLAEMQNAGKPICTSCVSALYGLNMSR